MKKLVSVFLLFVLTILLTGCGNKVKDVEEAIDSIGALHDAALFMVLQKQSTIDNAISMYNKLTPEEQKLVTNADRITKAEKLLKKANQAYAEAQTMAEALFTICASQLSYSESLQLKRAWCEHTSIGYYFTFEIERKDADGIIETLYYGNLITIEKLSDDVLAAVSRNVGYGTNMYFRINETRAKDSMSDGNSILLDADTIQACFIRNR